MKYSIRLLLILAPSTVVLGHTSPAPHHHAMPEALGSPIISLILLAVGIGAAIAAWRKRGGKAPRTVRF